MPACMQFVAEPKRPKSITEVKPQRWVRAGFFWGGEGEGGGEEEGGRL